MTFIGKSLVFLTFVLGVGAAVFGTAVYTQRPGWFADAPDTPVAKGQVVMSFKSLGRDIDTGGKAAAAAAAVWTGRYAELDAAEKEFKARVATHKKLLAAARTGAPVGFYALTERSDGRLDLFEPNSLTEKALAPFKGPDGKDLVGAENLQGKIQTALTAINTDLLPKINQHGKDVKRLGGEIDVFTEKVARQRVIREDQQNQAGFLAAAEVNVAEQQITADRRLRQLKDRMRVFVKD